MTETDSSPTLTARLTVPKIRPREWCRDRGPRYVCNRSAGHTGRHSFAWVHLDGRVRGVWS